MKDEKQKRIVDNEIKRFNILIEQLQLARKKAGMEEVVFVVTVEPAMNTTSFFDTEWATSDGDYIPIFGKKHISLKEEKKKIVKEAERIIKEAE